MIRRIVEAMDRVGGPSDVVEQLASVAHESWSGWMRHLFSKSEENPDGTVTIPADLVERWKRQVETPYEELSDEEKESDRREARKYVAATRSGGPEKRGPGVGSDEVRTTREPYHSMDMHDEPGEDDGW